MFSEKAELVKRAVKIAKERHPDGFNKAQLIEASKEVFGGYSVNPGKPITTMEDVSNMGNHMAYIDGHYPVGMSGCYVIGINGGCGVDCLVFGEGDCNEPQEFHEDDVIKALGLESAEYAMAYYSCFDAYFDAKADRR